jgi:hypothetical protein
MRALVVVGWIETDSFAPNGKNRRFLCLVARVEAVSSCRNGFLSFSSLSSFIHLLGCHVIILLSWRIIVHLLEIETVINFPLGVPLVAM